MPKNNSSSPKPPQRAKTAEACFKAKYRGAYSVGVGRHSSSIVTEMLNRAWNATEDKKEYEDLAKADKIRFDEEMEQYENDLAAGPPGDPPVPAVGKPTLTHEVIYNHIMSILMPNTYGHSREHLVNKYQAGFRMWGDYMEWDLIELKQLMDAGNIQILRMCERITRLTNADMDAPVSILLLGVSLIMMLKHLSRNGKPIKVKDVVSDTPTRAEKLACWLEAKVFPTHAHMALVAKLCAASTKQELTIMLEACKTNAGLMKVCRCDCDFPRPDKKCKC